MFWGLILEPNKRYTQVVETSFHVSMASLDVSTADDKIVQVMLCYQGRNYLLCSLKKTSTWQVPLDLNFIEGSKIAFMCNGQGHVHLTGYLIMEDDADSYMNEIQNEQIDEEEKVNKKFSKRKAAESPKGGKKLKRHKQEEITDSSDDDDDLEEDEIQSTNFEVDEEDTGDSEDEDDNLEDEDEDDSDEDDSDEDEEDEDEEDEEDEEEEKQQKKKMTLHLDEKKKKQIQEHPQQQLQQQKKKHDKQKLTNGKEIKQDQQSKQQKKNKSEQKPQQQQNLQDEAKKRVLKGGVIVEEQKIGNGPLAQPGKVIAVYSTGRLKNGKNLPKLDALEGEGKKFQLGRGQVLKGWDIGISGMKVGGKRRITIPPKMAYGTEGDPPTVPSNSTLVFDIELRKVY